MSKKKKNFFMAPNISFEMGLDPYQLAVYLYLTRCSNNAAIAFPAFSTIAEKSGMSERKAKNVVKQLEDMGLLETVRRWGDKGRQSNAYRVIEPKDTAMINAHGALTPVHDVHQPSAHGAQYKELMYKEPDYKEKRYIIFPDDDHEFFGIYNSYYKRTFNKDHPKITVDQRDRLCGWIYSLDIDTEDYEEAVENHFENLPEGNDGKIFAFMQASRRLLDQG